MVQTFYVTMDKKILSEKLIWLDDNKMTEKHWSFYSLQNKNG